MIRKTKVLQGRMRVSTEPTISLKLPPFLYIAATNASCPKADIYVQPGDQVKLYQVIGRRHGKGFDLPIHATCSGTYSGLEKHYYRNGKRVEFRKIENDGKDTSDPGFGKERSDEEVSNLTKKDRAEILKNTGSVGLGGSSYPTYLRFESDKKIDTILVNAVESEPFVSCDHALALEERESVIKGTKLLRQAFSSPKAVICFKKKDQDLFQAYGQYLSANQTSAISARTVSNDYPQGWENALVKSVTGKVIPLGHLPREYGIRNFNVATVVSIYNAIKYNLPTVGRLVSVSGNGVRNPANVKVRIGAPVKYVIAACGGYSLGAKKVLVLGGPRSGTSLPSDDAIVTRDVPSILVFNDKKVKVSPCIRCGSCVMSCPVGLQPVTIRNTRNTRPVDREKIKLLHPQDCIGCGLCSYSCTSHIDVMSSVARAKVIARLK